MFAGVWSFIGWGKPPDFARDDRPEGYFSKTGVAVKCGLLLDSDRQAAIAGFFRDCTAMEGGPHACQPGSVPVSRLTVTPRRCAM